MKPGSNLEKILEKGEFAVTGELGPPKGNDVAVIKRKAEYLRGKVDAVNVTDNQTSIVRMSSIATSALLIQMGLEPVMQMVTRDRNRIAIQSDILGATALGIKNMLCLSGDHQNFGNQKDATNVFDIDSIQLLQCVKTMRDEGKLCGGEEKIEGEIKLLSGPRPTRLPTRLSSGWSGWQKRPGQGPISSRPNASTTWIGLKNGCGW